MLCASISVGARSSTLSVKRLRNTCPHHETTLSSAPILSELGQLRVQKLWAKCWLRRRRLRRGGGGVHVRALMKGVGSMKRCRKEGSERRLRGDAGFANKANPAQRAEPLPPTPPPPPLPPGTAGEGREGEGGRGGGRKGGREGRGRVGSEGARRGFCV